MWKKISVNSNRNGTHLIEKRNNDPSRKNRIAAKHRCLHVITQSFAMIRSQGSIANTSHVIWLPHDNVQVWRKHSDISLSFFKLKFKANDTKSELKCRCTQFVSSILISHSFRCHKCLSERCWKDMKDCIIQLWE